MSRTWWLAAGVALAMLAPVDPAAAGGRRGRRANATTKAKPRPRAKARAKAKARPPVVEPDPEIEMEPEPDPPPLTGESAVAEDAARPEPTPPSTRPARAARRFYAWGGVAHVATLESSRELALADVDGAASLAVDNGPIAGSGAGVSSATIPALIVGYRLPWLQQRLALELVLGVPFTVKFTATGTLANESLAPEALGIPTGVMPLGPELGEAKAAPPTVTAVYSLPTRGRFTPYVGAGLSVLLAMDARVTNPTLIEVRQPDFTVSPAPGLVLQAGLQANLTERWFARLDVKFIALMLARASVTHVFVRTPQLPLFDTVEVGTANMSVWVNPLIVQAGVGAAF